MNIGFCEGDTCNRNGCQGVIDMYPSENCSCHLNAPCSACTAPRNFCPECDWEEADEPETRTDTTSANNTAATYPSWTPPPLDPTRIDWRDKPHSSCSMIKEGVYPQSGDDAADRAMVRKQVDGTFGGRFESFGGGKFKFIAYTD